MSSRHNDGNLPLVPRDATVVKKNSSRPKITRGAIVSNTVTKAAFFRQSSYRTGVNNHLLYKCLH